MIRLVQSKRAKVDFREVHSSKGDTRIHIANQGVRDCIMLERNHEELQ